VDAEGRPLVVYHGSPKRFYTFKDMPARTGNISAMGKGHYFTSNRFDADVFSEGVRGKTKTSTNEVVFSY
jgi:hypothetical protein